MKEKGNGVKDNFKTILKEIANTIMFNSVTQKEL